MNYSVRFQPEKRSAIINGTSTLIDNNVPLRLSIVFNNQRIYCYSGKRCDITQWDNLKQGLKKGQIAPNGQNHNDFNDDLLHTKWVVKELFKSYEFTKIIPTPAQVREDLKRNIKKDEIEIIPPQEISFFQYFKKYIEDAPVSPGRKRSLNTVYKKVIKFNSDTTFENLDAQYLSDFRKDLLKSIGRNTVCCELKRLRAFFGYANKMGWTTYYPFKTFTIDSESYGDPIFITLEERDQLYDAKIKDPKLSHVRDIFILQCFIGCRVGDLTTLKHSNIIDGCIEYIAGKTKDNKPRIARVPLTKKALAIIAKYHLPNGDLLPYIPGQKYNENLKELFKDQQICRMVTKLDPRTRNSIQIPICDIASSHMARRVFIGGLHHKGAKNEIIASMSGHVENSKAFARYYNIGKSDQQSAISLIE